MDDNSTGLIGSVGNSSFIQGIEDGVARTTGLGEGWSALVVAIGIALLAYLLAKVAKHLISDVAPRFVSRTRTTVDDHLLKAVNGPIQAFIFAVGIYLACATMNGLSGPVSDNLATALSIAMVYIAAYLVSNVVGALIGWYRKDFALKTGSGLDDSLLPFMGKIAWVLVFTLATLMALAILHIEITPLLATLGVGGIAVALAAQELLSNLFGAFAIISDRPYKIGDYIQISDDMMGDVVEIGLRSTRIRTLDGRLIVVPNATISNDSIINYSLPGVKSRFDVKVGIAYGADVEKASAVMADIAAHAAGVLADPAPHVYVRELGDYSVILLMYVWTGDYRLSWDISDYIYREILRRFADEKIDIPFPVRSVILNPPGKR